MTDSNTHLTRPGLRPSNKELPAELWLIGQRPRNCTISKVAANNLIFLSLIDDVEIDSQATLRDELADLMIHDGDTSQPLRIRTRISHRTRERWVLEPVSSNLPLLPVLKKALDSGEHIAAASHNLNHFRRGEILHRCRRIMTNYLSGCYAGFYSGLDDALFIAAATSSDNKNEFLSAVRLIEQSHTQLEHGFIERVCWLIDAASEPDFEPTDADFFAQASPETATKHGSRVRLSLETLSKQATSRNEHALDMLAQRFSSIVLRLCDDTTLPFGPAWLCRHFGDSIAAIALSLPAQQIIYEVFRDTILTNIGELYEQLNAVFVQYQILPGLEQSPLQKGGKEPRTRLPAVTATTETDTVASTFTTATRWENRPEDANTRQLFGAVMQLWTKRNAGRSRIGETPLTTTEVVAQLEKLAAKSSAAIGAERHQRSIGETLLAKLEQSYPGRLQAKEHATIAIADELMQNIHDKDQILDQARPLLKKLTLPFIKVALCDDGFFNEQHPARQCLNLIARLCREAHFSNAVVRRQLQAICERITPQSSNNPAVFSAILTPLRELAARQQQSCERNIKRVAASQEGQHKLNSAHAEVDEQLYQHFAGKVFPQILLQLLDSGWHKFMIHSLLKRGEDDSQWQDCLAVLHDLYYSLLPDQQRRSSIGRWSAIKPEVLGPMLERPLEELGIATVQYQDVLRELETTLQQHKQAEVLADFPDRRSSNDAAGAATAKTEDRWINRCRQLKAGDWLGWIDNPLDEPLQLAWIANDFSRYVLVNEQGHQLFDWPRNTLADNMQHGLQQLSNPDAWPVVDNGLYEIAQKLYRQLNHSASLDQQTGLLNHSAFENQLAELTKLARYSDVSHTLIGIDISQLATSSSKQTGASEAAIRASAGVIRSLLPDTAIIAHIGGAYFGILLPYRDRDYAQELAQQLEKTLRQSTLDSAHEYHASLGIVAVTGESSCTTTVLKQLHNLVQQAKCSDGERVLWQDNADQQQYQTNMLAFITQLGEILERDRLRLRCQSIVPLSDVAGVHHEILLGVSTSDGSVMLPGELIAAAELYNRMDIIDRWVVQRTFQWLRGHPKKASQLGRIHINLSGNSISNDLFLNFLLAELDRGGLPRKQFCFEIMESTAIVNLPKAADFIARIQARGCKVALDNFGRGINSFDYLRKLPVDYIKIDGSIVTTMDSDGQSAEMVDAINRIAHCTGKPTIAVCVETEALLHALENLGVDYAQGFGIAKPIMLSEA